VSRLSVPLRRYPYTSALVVAALMVPVLWGIAVVCHQHVSLLGQAVNCALAFMCGAGWVARWGPG
jgi:di/tricarboxylate transporter